jgi:hypothetical protein
MSCVTVDVGMDHSVEEMRKEVGFQNEFSCVEDCFIEIAVKHLCRSFRE